MSWSWPWATPRLCPNRDGSSLPLEEAGDGHLSIGFAQSRCPFLWAPSFLFGLLFHGHGGRPGHRGSLRLELFLTIGAGFTLVDFFSHWEDKAETCCEWAEPLKARLSRESDTGSPPPTSDRGRCAHRPLRLRPPGHQSRLRQAVSGGAAPWLLCPRPSKRPDHATAARTLHWAWSRARAHSLPELCSSSSGPIANTRFCLPALTGSLSLTSLTRLPVPSLLFLV